MGGWQVSKHGLTWSKSEKSGTKTRRFETIRRLNMTKWSTLTTFRWPPLTQALPKRWPWPAENKLVIKRMRLFLIFSIQQCYLTIDDHNINNKISNDCETLSSDNKPPISASPCLLVVEESPLKSGTSWQSTQTVPAEYATDRIFSHRGSENNLRSLDFWIGYSLEIDALKPAEHLPQPFIYCYFNKKLCSNKRRRME